jgi:hypothetical protein
VASVDLKHVYPDYTAKRAPALVTVPPRPHLMVDGHGDPNTSQVYRDAVETLYPLAYALRAAIKEATGDAYTVMPLEGLWWADDMSAFSVDDKSSWLWTLLICLPDAVVHVPTDDVITQVTLAKQLPAAARIEQFGDGEAAQVLHVGPFADEGPTIEGLHAFIDNRGMRRTGKHHEIYLSDMRRTDPAKLRTIIRQPVGRAVTGPEGH